MTTTIEFFLFFKFYYLFPYKDYVKNILQFIIGSYGISDNLNLKILNTQKNLVIMFCGKF